jgi:4'-phosphopantetheinyl transferase EntD
MTHFKRQTLHFKNCDVHLIFFDFFDFNSFNSILTEKERLRFDNFRHSQRKKEFIATRILKNELFGDKEIKYSESGAPYIENESFISISHTKNCAAIASCKDFAIGLDLELIQTKAQKVQQRFISKQESTFLDITDDLAMSRAWSCKEALYKLAGRRQILFKEHLKLLHFEKQMWNAEIINPNQKLFVKLISHLENDLIITINTEKIETVAIN